MIRHAIYFRAESPYSHYSCDALEDLLKAAGTWDRLRVTEARVVLEDSDSPAAREDELRKCLECSRLVTPPWTRCPDHKNAVNDERKGGLHGE
jgi:hypothetical protein